MADQRLIAMQRQDLENKERSLKAARTMCLAIYVLLLGVWTVGAVLAYYAGDMANGPKALLQVTYIIAPVMGLVLCVWGRAR